MSVSIQRKRVQYSVRALIVLMIVVAISAAAIGWWVQTSQSQRNAIEVIASKGGYVWHDRAGSYIEVEFTAPHPDKGCGQIHLLAGARVSQPTFEDSDMKFLNYLWRLRRVNFANTEVSPSAVSQFQESHPRVAVTQ